LQDGSNCSNQPSVLSSINSDSGISHALLSRSVDTTNLQHQLLIKSKSQAQQIIGTGNNGLGGINSNGSGGEVNHLEDLRLTNLLLDNNDQLVKGTVDEELKFKLTLGESQRHHSLGEYIHPQGYGSTLSNAYCNAVCFGQESSSSTYENPPADFGSKFYIVLYYCA